MFSGLVQYLGRWESLRNRELRVHTPLIPFRSGDSVAVNGVCLTLKRKIRETKGQQLTFDLSEETVRKTTLGKLRKGTPLNIEPALQLQSALGGHIVQGHVDGVGMVDRILSKKGMKDIWFTVPASLTSYLVPEASIAVDGVSLTMAGVQKKNFWVALVPHTLRKTNLDHLREGDPVNLEADIIAKYVLKYTKRK